MSGKRFLSTNRRTTCAKQYEKKFTYTGTCLRHYSRFLWEQEGTFKNKITLEIISETPTFFGF